MKREKTKRKSGQIENHKIVQRKKISENPFYKCSCVYAHQLHSFDPYCHLKIAPFYGNESGTDISGF